MELSQNLALQARASPRGDARRPCPSDVRNMPGLPTQGRSRPKKLVPLRLATINIGTLTGRYRELADSLMTRRVDVACVQETKWKGSKAKEIGEGYKVIYHGTSSTRNGIAVVISRRFHDKVTEVRRLSDWLTSVKIESESTTAHIISCYAPQTGCPDDEKDDFWASLDTHLWTIAPDEYVILGDDLNGHVGSGNDGYTRCHGGHGLGVQNNHGSCILDCAETHDLAVTNTYFKKRDTHLATYTSGGHATQIDYWMIWQRDLKLVVMDIRLDPLCQTRKEKLSWSSWM